MLTLKYIRRCKIEARLGKNLAMCWIKYNMRETFYVGGICEKKGLQMLVIKSVRYDVCALTDKQVANVERVRCRDLQPQVPHIWVFACY